MCGVEMMDGSVLTADTVLTGCSPYHTFVELMSEKNIFYDNQEKSNSNTAESNKNEEKNGSKNENKISENNSGNEEMNNFLNHIKHTDFSCGAFKINCAVNKLPNFSCFPSPKGGEVGPMHRGEENKN